MIDVKFPNVLNSIIRKKLKNKDINLKKKHYLYKYKYLKENPDEILQLQCICASIDDIIYIIKI